MEEPLKLARYSLGVGDRFAQQAQAQLQACMLAAKRGVDVVPVWNKSNREHATIGSDPADTRAAADAAVRTLQWRKPYHVDADHIRLETVDRFLPHADFYTLDVADSIGRRAEPREVDAFARRHPELAGDLEVPGIDGPFPRAQEAVAGIAGKYLVAVKDAGRIYRHIVSAKGVGRFITEVSMDETDHPQTPLELLVILAALADEGVPIQTLAPKFTGRFNKGVDYVGDLDRFEREFNEDLAVVRFAVERYALPENLKLSVHSGSDKFALYEVMRLALPRFGAGLHLKTAGTTWLEELVGLAEAGGSGLTLAKEVYARARERLEDLRVPYAAVIDIDPEQLPATNEVQGWTSERFVSALRHDRRNPGYNPHLRQLLHVGYKIAAHMGDRYLDALGEHRPIVARNVTDNLFERHLKPLFVPE